MYLISCNQSSNRTKSLLTQKTPGVTRTRGAELEGFPVPLPHPLPQLMGPGDEDHIPNSVRLLVESSSSRDLGIARLMLHHPSSGSSADRHFMCVV